MKNGTILMASLVGFTAVFGVALWYFQTQAYYEAEQHDVFSLEMTPVIGDEIEHIDVQEAQILNAETSPIKFRACFTVSNSLPMLTETYQDYPEATPLTAPDWFECFNAETLEADLATGAAVSFLGQKNIADGVDRVVVIYDDGRGYAWNQLNEKYKE